MRRWHVFPCFMNWRCGSYFLLWDIKTVNPGLWCSILVSLSLQRADEENNKLLRLLLCLFNFHLLVKDPNIDLAIVHKVSRILLGQKRAIAWGQFQACSIPSFFLVYSWEPITAYREFFMREILIVVVILTLCFKSHKLHKLPAVLGYRNWQLSVDP